MRFDQTRRAANSGKHPSIDEEKLMPTTADPSTKGQAKDVAREATGQASVRAGDVAPTAKDEVRTVTADAKNQAANVLHQSRSELRDRLQGWTFPMTTTALPHPRSGRRRVCTEVSDANGRYQQGARPSTLLFGPT